MSTGAETGAEVSLPKAIIFDLDGTLVDSAPDVRVAVNTAFEPLGVAPFDVEAVKRMIGGGAAKALERATRAAGLDPETVDQAELMKRFMDTYLEASKQGRGLYSGAVELLTALSERGVKLAICTNKADPVTQAAVTSLGIAKYFDAVIGARDDLPKKPDPQGLHEAMNKLAATSSETVMIGDTSADVGACRAAGIPIILMSYGYTPSPHDLGGDHVIDQLSDVLPILLRIGDGAT